MDARNPRYFADSDGRTLLLAGSHTWATIQEAGPEDPPAPFDWAGWLAFLTGHGHNFTRLWTWENAKWGSWYDGDYYFEPLPWARTGPGLARDGKPRFDLTRFDDDFFTRLRSRVIDSRDNGIYASVMLFQGWSAGNKPFDSWSRSNPVRQGPNPWYGHPFSAPNNVNDIDASPPSGEGDDWVHTLRFPSSLALQEAYVRKVVDTVADLDNVLYEISNESDGCAENTAWQYHMINVVHEYERARGGMVHPVLMTAQYPRPHNAALFASPADAVSPFRWSHRGDDRWQDEPPADYRGKVIISDTDHLWGVGGDSDWVWRTVMRGHNVLYMDTWGYTHFELRGPEPDHAARRALGRAAHLAQVVDLGQTEPHPDLASSGFVLARPGSDYIVYDPHGDRLLIDLSDAEGDFATVWMDPERDRETPGETLVGGGTRQALPPETGTPWVLRASRV